MDRTYSLGEINDRLAIMDLYDRQLAAAEAWDFAAYDTTFAADAQIDLRDFGVPAQAYPAYRDWLASLRPIMVHAQRITGGLRLQLDGDTATTRVPVVCYVTMETDGERALTYTGLFYNDRFSAHAGWLAHHRALRRAQLVGPMSAADAPTGGRLDGVVAIITGAARGQGEAEAREFVREGARVVVTDVLEAEGRAVADSLGDAARWMHLDVTSEQSWSDAVALAEQSFGKLNVVVNNAGIVQIASLLDTSVADYRRVIDVNQIGCFLGMKIGGAALVRAGGGSIINVSSTGGLEGVPKSIAYAASKHAITGMTKTAAIELGKYGIRVNSIHPGGVDTPMLSLDDATRESGFTFLPLGRVAAPAEIARVAVFLASSDSSYMTGSALLVDGGSMAGPLGWNMD